MILVNGTESDCISVYDRGFQYGDGLFETIEITAGQPVFWRRHLERLQAGCERLSLPFPDASVLAFEAHMLCAHQAQAVLKIIVTRGPGGRGYRQPDPIAPTRVLSLHPYPDYPLALRQQGIKARFCGTRLGLNPLTAGLKHLNRLEQVLARAEWRNDDIQEGLMFDIDGHVVAGTMSNLFVVKNGAVKTPPLRLCGIAGIVRAVILEAGAQSGLPVGQVELFEADVLEADAIFMTNALIGIWPVLTVGSTHFAVDAPEIRQACSWLETYKDLETGYAA